VVETQLQADRSVENGSDQTSHRAILSSSWFFAMVMETGKLCFDINNYLLLINSFEFQASTHLSAPLFSLQSD
jgi:hypothetical protein